ncbi:MAG: hypothetical protein QN122_09730 [Armatimonadota bacterium]|nr:hypothetical protein [Armatimonadota bacterium]MDR7487681.1 hypothetical protein [Armatimonadota bacterium]MDR7491711.1 hypothetical protein [Armatimonadota bacterium]MDR7575121.1 hypothetical protein [Armatimonadota bacterium]MDR7592352.1 hypothetical protein [Armatimonadota bacterium]
MARSVVEERRRILEMVREGKLSPEEAEQLLDALETPREGPGGRARLIRVMVRGAAGERVNLAVPTALADLVLRVLPRGVQLRAGGEPLDLARLVAAIRNGDVAGKLVDVTAPDGTHVEITVE